jgi:hypothetical protein
MNNVLEGTRYKAVEVKYNYQDFINLYCYKSFTFNSIVVDAPFVDF